MSDEKKESGGTNVPLGSVKISETPYLRPSSGPASWLVGDMRGNYFHDDGWEFLHKLATLMQEYQVDKLDIGWRRPDVKIPVCER